MSDLILAEESLRDGIQLQPFPTTITEGMAYYRVNSPERAAQTEIRVLREWMLHCGRSLSAHWTVRLPGANGSDIA
jgi:hypothetical protein